MITVTLRCLSTDSALAVAREADLPDQQHRARAEGTTVMLSYFDKRYPLNVAGWAFDRGHASDAAAADVIASL
jgi:hypothetical protein